MSYGLLTLQVRTLNTQFSGKPALPRVFQILANGPAPQPKMLKPKRLRKPDPCLSHYCAHSQLRGPANSPASAALASIHSQTWARSRHCSLHQDLNTLFPSLRFKIIPTIAWVTPICPSNISINLDSSGKSSQALDQNRVPVHTPTLKCLLGVTCHLSAPPPRHACVIPNT